MIRKLFKAWITTIVLIQFIAVNQESQMEAGSKPFIEIKFELDAKDQESLAELKPIYKLVLLSDSHVSQVGASPVFKAAVQKTMEINPDSVIFLGDMVHSDRYKKMSEMNLAWENFYREITFIVRERIPVFPLAGNHDAAYSKFNPNLKNSYIQFWRKYQCDIPLVAGSFIDSYAFELDNNLFIMLFTPQIRIKEQTLNWLHRVLTKTQGQYQNVFLFTHRPVELIKPYPPNFGIEKLDQAIVKIIKTRITAVFSGHLHIYGQTKIAGTSIQQYQIGVSGGNHLNVGGTKAKISKYWDNDLVRGAFGLLVITKKGFHLFHYKEKLIKSF